MKKKNMKKVLSHSQSIVLKLPIGNSLTWESLDWEFANLRIAHMGIAQLGICSLGNSLTWESLTLESIRKKVSHFYYGLKDFLRCAGDVPALANVRVGVTISTRAQRRKLGSEPTDWLKHQSCSLESLLD
uniref:Uncharacterized protein n=1 Tax=Romanomermis culicivorax TaxID=13658 RepID=A0A915JCF2_ROMCU